MPVPRLLTLAVVGLLGLNSHCQQAAEELPCPDHAIAGRSVQVYPCVPDRNGREAKLFVVNSQQEFADAFTCSSCRPRQEVFSDSTLLVGWKQYCCCGHVKSQRLVYSCASNTYTYKVELEPGACSAALPVTNQLLVPKLPAGAQVLIAME